MKDPYYKAREEKSIGANITPDIKKGTMLFGKSVGMGVPYAFVPWQGLAIGGTIVALAPKSYGYTYEEKKEGAILGAFGLGIGALKTLKTIPRKKYLGMSKNEWDKFQIMKERTAQQLKIDESNIAKIRKENLNLLEGLDRSAVKYKPIGIDITGGSEMSAVQERITPGKWDYFGTGKKIKGEKEVTQFAKTIKEISGTQIFKTEKEAISKIKETGRYYEPSKLSDLKSVDMYVGKLESGKPLFKLKELPPLKYSPKLDIPIQSKALEVSLVEGKVTRRIIYQWQIGSQGRQIQKRILTGVSKTGSPITEFEIFKPGKISQIKRGQLIIDKYPAARFVGKTLSKSKVISLEKKGTNIIRDVLTEQRMIGIKSQQVSPGTFVERFYRKPLPKSEWKLGTTIRKDISKEVIIEGKPIIDVKIDTRNLLKGVGAEVTTKTLFITRAFGIRTPKGYKPPKPITDGASKWIVSSGKKSSPQYLNALYELPTVKVLPPAPKVSVPTIRITPIAETKIGLSSQDLAPLMVGGLGKGESIYAGAGLIPEDASYIYTPISPRVKELPVVSTLSYDRVKLIDTLKSRQQLDSGLKTKTKTMELFKQPTSLAVSNLLKTEQVTKTKQITKQDLALKSAQVLKQALVQKTAQKQAFKFRQQISHRVPPPKTIPTIKPPIIFGLPEGGSSNIISRVVSKIKQGYEVKLEGKEFINQSLKNYYH